LKVNSLNLVTKFTEFTVSCELVSLNFVKCLLDVIQDIFYVLDTHAEANQIGCNTSLAQLLDSSSHRCRPHVSQWSSHGDRPVPTATTISV